MRTVSRIVYCGPVAHAQLKHFLYLFDAGSSLISVPSVLMVVDLVIIRKNDFD